MQFVRQRSVDVAKIEPIEFGVATAEKNDSGKREKVFRKKFHHFVRETRKELNYNNKQQLRPVQLL